MNQPDQIVVRFHGGFLDGKTVRSDDTRSGLITDYWNAEAVFLATNGDIGAKMFGVSPEGWKLFQRQASRGVVSGDLDQAYRVTSFSREGDVLSIDVQHDSHS
jgi:hypothetical protein